MVRMLLILSLFLPIQGIAQDAEPEGSALIYESCQVYYGTGGECVDSVLTHVIEDGYEFGDLGCYSTLADLAEVIGEDVIGADDYVASNGGGTGSGAGCIYDPD